MAHCWLQGCWVGWADSSPTQSYWRKPVLVPFVGEFLPHPKQPGVTAWNLGLLNGGNQVWPSGPSCPKVRRQLGNQGNGQTRLQHLWMNDVGCGGVCLWVPLTVWVRRPWWQTQHQADTAEVRGPQQWARLPDRTAVGWTQLASRAHLEACLQNIEMPSHCANCVKTCRILTYGGD